MEGRARSPDETPPDPPLWYPFPVGFLERLSRNSGELVNLSQPPIAEERSLVSISDPLMLERLGLTSPIGPRIDECTSMTYAAVFRSISIIASNIAGLDFGAYRTEANGIKTKVPSFLDDPYKPRPDMPPILSKFEWHELMMIHLLLHGNFYAEKMKNAAGMVIALNPIHPRCVHVEWDNTYWGGKKYTAYGDDGKQHVGGAERFIQIMGISLDGLRGISVLSAARLGIGIGLVGDESAYQMFDRGATISGMVTPRDGEELSDDDVTQVKRFIANSMTGAENTGDIAVINRRLEFMKWTMSAQDAQFLESRTFQIDEIGRWFGIPSHLLNLSQKSTSWGPGIEQQNIGLARYTLQPWTNRVSSRLSMLVPRGQTVEYLYDTFLRPEPQSHITSILAQISGGLITPNEGRQMMNMAPIVNGDELKGGNPIVAPVEAPISDEIGSELESENEED